MSIKDAFSYDPETGLFTHLPMKVQRIDMTAAPQPWTSDDVSRLRQLAASGKTWREWVVGQVPCYVLDDGQKIIGRTSATELLTGIKGGGALEKYIAVKALEPFINKDLVLERFVPFRLLEVEGPAGDLFCAGPTGDPKASYCASHRVMSAARVVGAEYAEAAE